MLPRIAATARALTVLVVGLGLTVSVGPVAQADTTLTTADIASVKTLWSLTESPALGLTAGPEVGWNAGLRGLRPPAASYYRLWDMQTAWKDVNPAAGVFDFSVLDSRVAQVEGWGGKPIIVLGLTPTWAAKNPGQGTAFWGAGSASVPADMSTWQTYVSTVAQRYGSRIGAYELWNEANLQTFWQGTPAELAQMTAIAAAAIADRAPLLAPSVTTRLASGGKFTTSYIDALGADVAVLDGWAIHSYPKGDAGPTPDDACAARVQGIVDWEAALVRALGSGNAGLTKPIWDTEVNYGLAGPGATPARDWSDADGAALLNCTYIDSRDLGIERTIWYEYTAADYALLGVQMTPQTPLINAAWAALPGTVASGPRHIWTAGIVSAALPTLAITGSRITVSGKPGVQVDGVTTGFAAGEIVRPFVRFPGETGYTQGVDRTVGSDGTFTWQRKTGKKVYVYFTNSDGSIRSNSVIIPAS